MGLEDEEIGNKLRIKYNTVRTHLGNMCSKVGVRGKSGLILTFVEVLSRAKI
jgi:DNA-binding CsgD family transcriptional regulator